MKLSGTEDGLLLTVRRLRSRRRNYILLRGAALCAVAALLLTAAACILSFFSVSAVFYAALKALVLAGLISAAALFIFIPLLRRAPGPDIIDELESLSPGLGEETLGALELKRGADGAESRTGASRELTGAFVKAVSSRLGSAGAERAYPVSTHRKYAIPLAAAVILCTVLLYTAPRGFTSYLLSARALPSGGGDYLELADIEITLTYPDYTGLPERNIKDGTGDVEALKGTKALIRARPVGGFGGGTLIVKNGPSLPVEKTGSTIETGFTVLGDGGYVIRDNKSGLTTREFAVKVVPDSEPVVKISSPSGDYIESDGIEEIAIDYDAADDFGLSELKLVWESESGRSGKSIGEAGPGNREYRGKTVWSPGAEALRGGTIKISVEAADNDSVSGPNTGRSNTITVKLRDVEERHREVLGLAGELMEELLKTLTGEINVKLGENMSVNRKDGANGSGKSISSIDMSAVSAEQESLTGQIDNSLSLLRKLIDSMKEDELSDYTYFAALSNMEVRVASRLNERRGITQSLAAVDIPRLGRLMDAEISEFEDDILFLDSMIKAEQLRESLQASKELMKQYGELSDMMKKLDESDDAALGEEIMKKLDRIREMLAELAQKMSALSAELQEGFLNPDAFQSADMGSQLDEITKLAAEGRTEEALELLSKMTAGLQSMMMSLQGGLQSFSSSSLLPDLSKLNEIISRIEGLEKEEAGLKEKTEGVKQSLIENPRSAEDNLREFIEKQQERIGEIKRNLARAGAVAQSPDSGDTEGAYLIDRTMQRADELGNWLETGDLAKALKSSESLEESAQALGELGRAGIKSLAKNPVELNNSARLAGDIRRDLEKLAKSSSSDPGFSEMADRQDEIRSDTDELSGQISDMSGELPLDPAIGEKIDEAGSFMSEASKTLEGSEISKAISNQDEAVRALREAREQAQEMMRNFQASAGGGMIPVPMALGQRGMQQGTQGVDTRYVEIPAADDSEIGKEFKEKILRAMKGGSPEGYGELNKKYYDRIIK